MKSKLEEVISKSDFVKLAIVEAIHRYYYDNVLDEKADKNELAEIGDYLSNLWCLYPDWRRRIMNYMERYKGGYNADILKDMPVCNKPRDIQECNFKLQVNMSISFEQPPLISRKKKRADSSYSIPIENLIAKFFKLEGPLFCEQDFRIEVQD